MTRKKSISDLSDDEIDSLLLSLLEGVTKTTNSPVEIDVRKMTGSDLRRLRSINHPDKSTNPNLKRYREAIQEIERRRKEGLPF